MLLHVRERLRDHVVRRRLESLGELPVGQLGELDREGRTQRECLERGDEPALGEDRRMEPARQLPQLVEPGRELVDDRVEHLPVAVDGVRREGARSSAART